jgi:hypothetical protein
LDPRGNVHGVPEDVGAGMDHVSKMDADPNAHPVFGRMHRVVLAQKRLYFDRAVRGVQRALELDEERVSDRLDLEPSEAREDLPEEPVVSVQ